MTWTKLLDKTLTKKLIGLSHPLKPAVVIGRAGLTDAVVEQVRRVQNTHDLVKIRIEMEDRDQVQRTAVELAQKVESTLVNRIGKVALLYKPREAKADQKEPPAPKRRPRR